MEPPPNIWKDKINDKNFTAHITIWGMRCIKVKNTKKPKAEFEKAEKTFTNSSQIKQLLFII